MRLIRIAIVAALLVGLAALGYGVMLRRIPVIATDAMFDKFFAAGRRPNQVIPARIRSARDNLVVMDNPDTVTRSIIYDVADAPLLIEMAVPRGLEYWSISVFARDTRTLFVRNDRQIATDRFRVVIRRGDQAVPAGVPAVTSPSDRGFVIFRGVTRDRSDPADVARTIAAMAEVTARPVQQERVR